MFVGSMGARYGMGAGSVEHRQVKVRLPDQHRDLGAAEDDPIGIQVS